MSGFKDACSPSACTLGIIGRLFIMFPLQYKILWGVNKTDLKAAA